MKAIAIALTALVSAGPAAAADIMRLGAKGTDIARVEGTGWFASGGKRSITIVPTASPRATERMGSYAASCSGEVRAGTFIGPFRLRLTGRPARCAVRVDFSAAVPDDLKGGVPVAVRLVVRVR